MVKRNVRKMNRSGAVPCPICESRVPLVEHHIHGREVKRWNEEWNIVWLCSNCHDLVHTDGENRIILMGWYSSTSGRRLYWYRHGEEPPLEGPQAIPFLR
jgi:hypothetical protein